MYRRRRGIPATIGNSVGFPLKLKFKHLYHQTETVTTTLGTVITRGFACNGLTQPKIGMVTTQPQYFDQLTPLYNHYTVIASRCIVKAIAAPNSTNSSQIIGIYIEDDSATAPSSITDFLNQRPSKSYRIMGPTNGIATLVSKWSAKKRFGGSPLSDDNLKGSVSGNPVEQQFYNIYVGPTDTISTTVTQFVVEVEYIAIWHEPRNIQSS